MRGLTKKEEYRPGTAAEVSPRVPPSLAAASSESTPGAIVLRSLREPDGGWQAALAGDRKDFAAELGSSCAGNICWVNRLTERRGKPAEARKNLLDIEYSVL